MVRILCLVILAGFVAVMGCEKKTDESTPRKVTTDDIRRDASNAAEYTVQSKDEFQKTLETQLDELDAEIAKLREKGLNLKDEAKASWERKMADLEPKREAARANLAEVAHSSAEAWQDVQKRAQSAWNELDKAIRNASTEFGSTTIYEKLPNNS